MELKGKLFLHVPLADAEYYRKAEAFGAEVAEKFRDVASDIESAGTCIALDLPTAAVFHLMRVVERGVQLFGNRLGTSLDTKNTDWQKI